MYSVRKILRIGLFAATTFVVAAAFGTFSSDVASADGHHYKERNAAMKSLGGNMKKLGGAVAGGNAADAEAAAKAISAVAAKMPALFKDKEIPAESRAKPGIWDNMADFNAKAAALGAAADKVAASAAGGTMGSDPKAVVGSIGATCGACHKVYRGPKA
ncbi:MAG: cytochrome c [Alphaproteobacteria bacterium]|nr:cytochrome c [Alphaproteobacteria bacterium]